MYKYKNTQFQLQIIINQSLVHTAKQLKMW